VQHASTFLGLISEALRANYDKITNEPLPGRWVELIHDLDERGPRIHSTTPCRSIRSPRRRAARARVRGLEIYDELDAIGCPTGDLRCLNLNRVSTDTPVDSNGPADLYAFDALYGLAQTFNMYHSRAVLTFSHRA
jgi:hypothetical protein